MADDFASVLIAWQRSAGRHDLPWQNTRDPYRIWLSEIMLQQTQVAAVIPYYLRFLEHFPDVASLAAAPADTVMHLWAGLGYYSRARNLHACAKKIVAEFGGRFPADPAVIATLPGIGRSTAAAIAAFAWGARAAILDGNVKRVLCRAFAIDGYPGERAVEQRLWQLADSLLPADTADLPAYTQGLMDLGATLCKPRNPTCLLCPLSTRCQALAQGKVESLPTTKVRAPLPERAVAMLVLRHREAVLLEKRPPQGIWGGLWSLPELSLPGALDLEDEVRTWARGFGAIATVTRGAPFVHGFTHYRLHVQPVIVTLRRRAAQLADAAGAQRWMEPDEVAAAGLPAPVRKLLMQEAAQP